GSCPLPSPILAVLLAIDSAFASDPTASVMQPPLQPPHPRAARPAPHPRRQPTVPPRMHTPQHAARASPSARRPTAEGPPAPPTTRRDQGPHSPAAAVGTPPVAPAPTSTPPPQP